MALRHPHDIEIPPPRPKRKPYNSYPRKTGAASRSPSKEVKQENLSKTFVLLGTDEVVMDAKIKEPVKTAIEQNTNLAFGEGTSSTSIYYHHNGTPERSEHMPTIDDLKETRARLTNDADLQIFGMSGNFTDSPFGFTTEEKWKVLRQMEKPFTSSKDNQKGGQSHENIAAQFEGTKYSGEGISTSLSAQLEANADLNLSLDSTRTATHMPKNSSMSSIHQAVPSISLHKQQFNNDDNPFSALISLTNSFPSLLASALSQNPAVHQAASVAAAFLPPTYVDFSMNSNPKLVGEGPEKQSSASSGISAIVTATVAAASAWWRVHGLLPSVFQPNHAFTPLVMVQTTESTQVHEDNSDSKENVSQNHKQKFQRIDYPEQHETNKTIQPCSALLEPSSSPDTCESTKIERPSKSTTKCMLSSVCGMQDVNHVQGKKKHDPSSCDSNTSPSCEGEKDAALNKEEAKGINEEGEECPSIIQEFRDTPQNSKSCSEGLKQGSLAFEALFSLGGLPQSFSPLHLVGNRAINSGNEEALGLQIDLNRKVFTATTSNIFEERARSSSNNGSGVATYKRHLVETEERNNNDQEESSRKRASM